MPENRNALDLAVLAEEVKQSQKAGLGQSELAVLGGHRPGEQLVEFLNSWEFPRGDKVWWLCGWAHSVRFFFGSMAEGRFSSPPLCDPEVESLQRLRVFGEPGDLDLRREAKRVPLAICRRARRRSAKRTVRCQLLGRPRARKTRSALAL